MTTETPVMETTPTTPAATIEPVKSLIGEATPSIAPAVPIVFTPDTTKSAAENLAAKAAFDTAAAAKDVADKEVLAKAEAAKANDTRLNPFKAEEIKLPEGLAADETTQKSLVELINKHGVPRDAVNDLLALQANVTKSASERNTADWNKMQETWRDQITKDPIIGGDKLAPTLANITKVIDKFGSPELRQALDLTGAGNNPAIIKFMAKIADQFKEGSLTPASNPGSQPISAAQKIYPSK